MSRTVFQSVEPDTDDLFIEAAKQSGLTFQYVRNEIPEICLVAVNQDIPAVQSANPDIIDTISNALAPVVVMAFVTLIVLGIAM